MRDSITFYRSFRDGLIDLDDRSFRRLVMAILDYGLDNKEAELTGLEKSIYIAWKANVDASNKRKDNGNLGGRPKKGAPEKPMVMDDKTNGFNVETNGFDSENHWLGTTKPNKKENKKEKEKNNISIEHDADEVFDRLWERYPRKKGKSAVSKSQRQKLLKIGEETLAGCLDRFLNDMQGRDIEYIPYGSTFFNSGYKDYLPDAKTYSEPEPKPDKCDSDDGYPVGFVEICKEHGAYWEDVDNVDMRMCLENDEWFPDDMKEWMHKRYVLQTV